MTTRKYPMVKVKEVELHAADAIYYLTCFAGHTETRPVKRRRFGTRSVPDRWPTKFRCARCAGSSS